MASVVLNEAVSGGGGGRPGCMTSQVGGGGGGSLESYRYYVSRRTVMEMLSDRGYNVADSDLTRSFTKFRTAFGQNPDLDRLTICVSLSSNSKNKIMVMFCGTDEIRKASVRAIHAILLNKDISSLMLVLQSKMNSSKRELLPMHLHATMDWRRNSYVVKITYHGGTVGALKTYHCIV